MPEEQELPSEDKKVESSQVVSQENVVEDIVLTSPTQDERVDNESAMEISSDSTNSIAEEVKLAREEVQAHQQRRQERVGELAEKSPQILQAENESELKKSVIEAEMASDPNTTKEQAEKRYEDFKSKLLAMGGRVVEWFEGGIKDSSFAKLIDFIFSGKNESSFSSNSKESSINTNTVGQNEFFHELSHQESFAKVLSNAYESGENRLKNFKGFNLSQENIKAAENGDRVAFESLLKELNNNFSGAHGEENWAAFKKVFAESLYPGKTNIELDNSIKDVINQMVRGDKFEQYLGKVDSVQDKAEDKQG